MLTSMGMDLNLADLGLNLSNKKPPTSNSYVSKVIVSKIKCKNICIKRFTGLFIYDHEHFTIKCYFTVKTCNVVFENLLTFSLHAA